MSERRIRETVVPALFPESGAVRAALYGEAPGPRGADCSGIPFWGDRSGRLVYRALAAAGMADVPDAAWERWDGAELSRLGLHPTLHDVVLSNVYGSCPTRDGHAFHAPSDRALRDPANVQRIANELRMAIERCPGTLRVVALGRRAAWALGLVAARADAPAFTLHDVSHPSAQALLSTAPDHGRGRRLAELEAAWEAGLVGVLKGG
jgi:uracil-DNA glycosylase